jgi:hypothetical protein
MHKHVTDMIHIKPTEYKKPIQSDKLYMNSVKTVSTLAPLDKHNNGAAKIKVHGRPNHL